MPQFAEFALTLQPFFSSELWEEMVSAPMPSLGDGPRCRPLMERLKSGLDASDCEISDSQRLPCVSALWLLAGDIDRSHTISQDLPDRDGSFLHGIMHRREGDFGNAKYWFRRVGDHPCFPQIVHETGGVYSDPFEFVDACAAAGNSSSESLEQAQWVEWQALLMAILTGAG